MKELKNKKDLQKEFLGEDFYYKKSLTQVYKNMSKEEKKLLKQINENKSQTVQLRTKVMVKILNHKNGFKILDEETLNSLKEISFKDSESNLIWHAMNYKAENDTSLSVMDLYSSGYMALNNAWESFLNKTDEEIEKDIKREKTVYASFKTFSEKHIKNSIVCEIMKQKAIDNHTFDVPKTARYYAKLVSNTIHSFVCMTGKMPTIEVVANTLNLSVRTVKNCFELLEFGDENNSNEPVFVQEIIKDFDFSTAICEDLNPLDKCIKEKSKNDFWNMVKEILSEKQWYCLTNYFAVGKTYQEIGDEINLTRERVRQIISESMNIIKTNPDLLELLIESTKK